MPLARHTPRVVRVVKAALAGTLPTAEYPYLRGEPPPLGTYAAAAATGDAAYLSQPGGLGSWALHGTGEGRGGDAAASASKHRRKMIVVVLGGTCHGELRHAHDLSELHGWELYFGATALYTPLQFVRALSEAPAQPTLALF